MQRQRSQTEIVINAINEIESTVAAMAHSTAEAAETVQQADVEVRDVVKRVEEVVQELNALSNIYDFNLLVQETAGQANEASQVGVSLTQVTGQLATLIEKFKT